MPGAEEWGVFPEESVVAQAQRPDAFTGSLPGVLVEQPQAQRPNAFTGSLPGLLAALAVHELRA